MKQWLILVFLMISPCTVFAADGDPALAGGAFHDGFSDFVANEHIDWTTDQGDTVIHSGNYTDTNTTYTATDFDIKDLTDSTSLRFTWSGKQDAFGNQTANTVYAGPVSGEAAAPAFRSLVANDIPDLSETYVTGTPWTTASTSGSAASLSISGQSGLLTFTGLASTNRAKTVRDAADTLLELGGSYTPTGTWNWASATATWPTFNQNTSGTAANVSGTVAIANGGTGQTTAQAAIDALTQVSGATNEHVLTKDTATGNAVWKAASGGGYTNLTSFVDQTAWRLFYSNGDGDVTELALGADGTYLKSNGASAAPSFATLPILYKTIYIDAGAMVPATTSPAATGTKEYGTNDLDADYFAFDAGATEERVQFKMVMPEDYNNGTVKAKFYWSSATGSTAGDTVEWGIKAVAIDNDGAMDAAKGTAVTVSDTLLANDGADLQISEATGAMTIGGTPALGKLVVFEVYRNTDGTDNMTEDAWLFGVLIQYQQTATPMSAW